MRLDRGLFKLDFSDHHAVLGLPLDADSKVVRKRYLQIARKLHPDSMAGSSATEVQKASETLSKLVNPAYETLSQEKASSEHQIVLKLKGQTLQQSNTLPEVDSEMAQKLLKSSQLESEYRQGIRNLAQDQYEHLDNIEATIGQLSELNLVYLYRTSEGNGGSASRSTSKPAAASSGGSQAGAASADSAPPPPPRRVRETILESYINRAQDFERSKDSSRAILELREALKTYPNSAECHSYLASLYLKAGQATMAKIHAKRALDINPKDEKAQQIQARIERSSRSSEANKANSGGKGGGLFGGLFGGKKK